MSIDVITEAIHEHMNDKRVSSLRKLILTLIVTAEQNTRIFQYHDKNFTEKKLTSWGFNNIPATAETMKNEGKFFFEFFSR